MTAVDLELGPFTASATVVQRGAVPAKPMVPMPLGRLELNVPGRHNVQNALAAVAVGLELGLHVREHRRRACASSEGRNAGSKCAASRNGVLIVDDYGHHPTEIAAVLSAARALNRRIVVAFQPHRYTRTVDAAGRIRPGARGRRLSRADRHLRSRRDTDCGCHARSAGRRRSAAPSARRSTSSRMSRMSRPRLRALRGAAMW